SCLEILCDFKASLNIKDQVRVCSTSILPVQAKFLVSLHFCFCCSYNQMEGLTNSLGLQPRCDSEGPLKGYQKGDGVSPLMLAAKMNHSELCRYLLHRGAAVNTRDQKGRTALMVACENGSVETVEALIHGGARVGLIDAMGRDAAHYGAATGNALIQHYLQEAAQRHSWASGKTPEEDSICSSGNNQTQRAPRTYPPSLLRIWMAFPHIWMVSKRDKCTSRRLHEVIFQNSCLFLELKGVRRLPSFSTELVVDSHFWGSSRLLFVQYEKENTSYDIETLQDEEGELLEFPATSELLSKKTLNASTEELLATLQGQIESLTQKNKKLMEKIQVLEKDEKEQSEADTSGDFIPVILYDSLRSEFEKLKGQQLEAQELLESLESNGTDGSPRKLISAEAYEQLKDDYEKQIAALKEALEKISLPDDQMIRENRAMERKADSEPEGKSKFNPVTREELEQLMNELNETQEKYQAALVEVKILEDQIELGILSMEEKEAEESSRIELETVKATLHQTREELKERDQKMKNLEGLLRVQEERGAQNCSTEAYEEVKATLGASLDAMSQEKEVLLKRCTSVETELRELRASLEEERHEMLEGRSSVSQALQEETTKLREQLKAMTKQHEEVKAHVEELREGRKKLEEELQVTKERLASQFVPRVDHEDVVEKLKATLSEAEERLLEMKEKYTSTQTELTELQKTTEMYRRESVPLAEHARAKEALEGTLWELKAKAKLLEQELKAKAQEAFHLQVQLDEVRQGAVSTEAHEQLRATLQAEIEALKAKLSDLGSKHEQTCTEVFQVQREALFMKSEKHAAEAQLAAAEKQLQSLRAESERLQELHSHIEHSAKLVKEKDKKVSPVWFVRKITLGRVLLHPESERRHSNIISLYRGHLLYAIQGHMDEDVQRILFQILKMQRLQEQSR
uniref:Ankyrin repeat domain 24 n=1 Tax=Laticauda laticaudata TaxID=8630 RepID=A0A8C5RE09_LATLA